MKWNNPNLQKRLNETGMETRDIKKLITSLQELVDQGEEVIFFEGTLLCIEEGGVCNCITSTEDQM